MLSARRLYAEEALRVGLVSRICKDQTSLEEEALALAKTIASKSPVATLGVKTLLNYSRDHTVDESLRFSLTWNAAMLQSNDVKIAGQAFVTKESPIYDNLVPLQEFITPDKDAKAKL
jgi:enoyl-CoA hydratase/carnithine racemase